MFHGRDVVTFWNKEAKELSKVSLHGNSEVVSVIIRIKGLR